MSTLAWHVTNRLVKDRVLAPDASSRRALAAAVFRTAEGSAQALLCFHVPDTHLHLLCVGDRAGAGLLARSAESAIVQRLGLPVGFGRAYFEPVETRRHLENAFHYIMGQKAHHETSADPLHEASNLPDLLGMRIDGRFTVATVRSWLPRLKRGELLRHFGVADLGPGTSPAWIADAASAAVCAPSLAGRSRTVVAARGAAVHVGLRQGLDQAAVAKLLGAGVRTVGRMAASDPDPDLLEAVVRGVGLREALGAARLSPSVVSEPDVEYGEGDL